MDAFETYVHRARSILFYKGEQETFEFMCKHMSAKMAFLAVKAAKLMNGYWLEDN